MITLTLNPGAVNCKVFPVGILLVVGATRLGCAGELLSVGAPCNCCKVPVFATEENGSSNVRSVLFCTVFEIYNQVNERLHFRAISRRYLYDHLMRGGVPSDAPKDSPAW